MSNNTSILKIENLTTEIHGQMIHQDLNLDVKRGEILGLVGASGSGKTVLLRTILGLLKPKAGKIVLFGSDIHGEKSDVLRTRCGVLFQSGALFSSLTVEENIQVPMEEMTNLPPDLMREISYLKLAMVGLSLDAAQKLPSELSGGMVKRVALARALAVDAELLFLDEPTSGLDPISAEKFDQLLRKLQHNLNLTVFMVTHDLDSLYAICDRIAVLVDRKVIVGTIDQIKKYPHPWIKDYFSGERGRGRKGT
ncbi:ABC transporter ATP-binding protein [Candidatus Nucleicultrix amoebiphila]|jgi:phospholipid/cholesterol/gamma-HCH transport system ATP-binding protein|uniref:Iron ABC transporter ATP-binding protein n=1 Tax=Candidatus Nucleicultrix amoebiphila FS5 TaxID=1414854 RepID=A0A1W6N5C8_9PROT|nr:ATP-binding cassette domain-containing protein [Candidatus Nucleicultrix amoebiphila]ARN84949.1 iron ABC transporter ATP-binding protein [Candidatus Nucleicultrix amoebiphila FS5]